MASFDGNLPAGGNNYKLRLNVTETSTNAAANTSVVAWSVQLIKGAGSGRWADGPHYWSANIGGHGFSGSIPSYDFRSYSVLTLGSGSVTITHSPDGTYNMYSSAAFDDGNAYGNLGDGSTAGWLTLATLRVAPGTPSGMSATRVSDTQMNLSWSISHASNGVPTSVLIQHRINGGAWTDLVNLGNVRSASVATAANRKTEYRARAANSAGTSAFSAASSPDYTTPAAPSNVTAVKNAGLDIVVNFTENVAYTEYEHEVWHGTVTGGVTTWDGSVLATLASGVTTYTHTAPDPSFQHVYRVRAKAGALLSGYATSSAVQLLAPPNAPNVPSMAGRADKASDLTFGWNHNPVDTTAQTAYEFQRSTNGGSSWVTTGKVTSTANAVVVDGGTYAADTELMTRVRTWGQATTGGAEGTGASPWSAIRTVRYQTVPTATITTPAEGASLNDSVLRVTVGFSQPEGASFVKTQLELLQGATLLETKDSTQRVGVTMATPIENLESYTIRARVQDSNGLWSDWDENAFSVAYLAPMPAEVTVEYLPDNGFGQVELHVPAPSGGLSEAVTISISRIIENVEEIIVTDYPVEEEYLTFLDTTPTIHGTNIYKVTTYSALGAKSEAFATLETEECRRAYLSKGTGFAIVGVFGGNLEVDEALSVASDTVQAAGRSKPVGLYGVETNVQIKVSSFVFPSTGFSTMEQLRSILLVPGKACFRDATGRRIFGTVQGSLKYRKSDRGELSFTMTETS